MLHFPCNWFLCASFCGYSRNCLYVANFRIAHAVKFVWLYQQYHYALWVIYRWFYFGKWLIISKKPWFTGIQAGFQAEFTTNLLLLRERALICRPEPCKPSHQHTALRKNKWKLNTTHTRRFSIPTRENRNAAFFMPSCYAVGAKRALLYAALRAHFCRGQGFIPNPGKMAFYRVTNPQYLPYHQYSFRLV